MGSPFPGMNPYLENPTIWANLHSRLIVAIANLPGPKIRPKYRVVVEEAVYKRDESDQSVLIGVPDVSVRQSSRSNSESSGLIAEGNVAIAAPKPVEVTVPMPVVGYEMESHYRVLVSDSGQRPYAQLYPFTLQQTFPVFWVPLKPEDSDIGVDLKPLLDEIYELSGYDLDIDYRQEPVPEWSAVDLAWLDQRLKLEQLR